MLTLVPMPVKVIVIQRDTHNGHPAGALTRLHWYNAAIVAGTRKYFRALRSLFPTTGAQPRLLPETGAQAGSEEHRLGSETGQVTAQHYCVCSKHDGSPEMESRASCVAPVRTTGP